MDRKRMDRVMGYVEELAQRDREWIAEQITGVPIGQEQVDDETFRGWFELTVLERGPIWAQALSVVEGGSALLRRYERIVGLS